MSYTSKALVFPNITLFLLEDWQEFRTLCASEVLVPDPRVDLVASVFAKGPSLAQGSILSATTADLADHFGVSVREVRGVIRPMVDARVIHRLGRAYIPTAILASDPFVNSPSGQAGVLTSGPFHFGDAFNMAKPLLRRVN